MDVSHTIWDFVSMASKLSCDEIKKTRVYQSFECASFLNRTFIIDEASLLDSSLVSKYPKGVYYNHMDASYHFSNMYNLFYGTAEMLSKSIDFNSNRDAQEKFERIMVCVKTIEKYEILNELTSHLSKLKLVL
jgi:hypothetical protein